MDKSDGDGDGVIVDVDTVSLDEPSSSNALLPYHVSTEQNAKTIRAFESLISCTDTFEISSLAHNVSSSLDSKDTGSINNERNFKSLKHCWLCQPGSKKATVIGGGG